MPKDFNEVSAYGEFEPLKLGGHVCKIMNVEETHSSTNKPMLKINLDIAEGEQKDYYSNDYKRNTKENKKWGCTVYQLIYDTEGKTSRGFKTFITSVEESNNGFKASWGDTFSASFKGKLIGGIFGREQYLDKDGHPKFSTKCFNFRSVETIRKGVEIPADKMLYNSPASNTYFPPAPTNAENLDYEEVKMPWDN
jgi:hypothetical protein